MALEILRTLGFAYGGEAFGKLSDGRICFFRGGVPGETVEVRSARGEFLAHGAYAAESHIPVKLWNFTDSEAVDEAFCKAIEKIGKKHKGTVPLQAQVIDPSQKLSLTMGATDLRVKVRDAIPELEQLRGVYDIKPMIKS